MIFALKNATPSCSWNSIFLNRSHTVVKFSKIIQDFCFKKCDILLQLEFDISESLQPWHFLKKTNFLNLSTIVALKNARPSCSWNSIFLNRSHPVVKFLKIIQDVCFKKCDILLQLEFDISESLQPWHFLKKPNFLKLSTIFAFKKCDTLLQLELNLFES